MKFKNLSLDWSDVHSAVWHMVLGRKGEWKMSGGGQGSPRSTRAERGAPSLELIPVEVMINVTLRLADSVRI